MENHLSWSLDEIWYSKWITHQKLQLICSRERATQRLIEHYNSQVFEDFFFNVKINNKTIIEFHMKQTFDIS